MKNLFQSIVVLFLSIQLNAQQKTITGTVTKVSDGSTLPGASIIIIIKGTSNGAQTDFNGKYSIQVSQSDILVI
jgi:hypothetical protein